MLANLHALLPLPVHAAALGLIGAVSGPALARFAAKRTVQQPLAMELAAEMTFLTGVLAELRRLPYVTTIAGEDFAAGSNGRIWKALIESVPEVSNLSDDLSEEEYEQIGVGIDARREEVLASVTAALAAGPAPVGDQQRLAELLAGENDGDQAVIEAGHAVINSGQDRNRLNGSGLIMETSTPDSVDADRPPLQRVHVEPSRLRTAATSAAAAVGAALIPAFAHQAGYHGFGAVLACAALLSLLVLSVVIALVDLDTFYVDVRVFLPLAFLSWLLTAAAAGDIGQMHRLISGVALIAFTALLFNGANLIYRWVRGMDGQGLGDSLIVLATIGVPPALTGAWMLGYYSVMAGLFASIGGWVIGFLRGKLTRTSPYAFGPYLAGGWLLGWVLYLAHS